MRTFADGVLTGSGDNEANQAYLAKLEHAFPERELVALKAWLGTFYGYQQNWLFDLNRYSILVKCRQIGASHTYAAAAILWALLGEDTSIVSIGQREADDVLEKVTRHADALERLGSTWARKVAKNATRVALAAGGSIHSLPSTSGGRGKSGNVLLDEAAYYEHPDDVWDGASSTTMHGGFRMRIMSTPNGVGNMFHGLVKEPPSGYRVHRTTVHDAIADGMPITIEDCMRKAKGDKRLFSQLYECKFLDGEMQYIPSFLIEACSTDDLPVGEGAYFGGLDIGKTADLTVLTVKQKISLSTGSLYVVREIQSHKRTDSDGLEAMVASAFKKYQLRRLCVDATGMGAFPAERLRKRHGLSKVEPIAFTLQVKEDLATSLYTAFVEQTIRIPKTKLEGTAPMEPEKLAEDIASLKRIITTAGNVRYDAPHTSEGHADRAWSLAMALHAAMTAPSYARM